MMTPEPEKSEVELLEILQDGIMARITFRDGTEEKIKIKKVAIRDMRDLGAAWGKEAEEIRVYTGMSAQWVERLSDDSWNLVMEEGRRLNFTHFAAYWKRQTGAIEALGDNRMTKLIADATSALLKQQNTSSPEATKTL